MLQNKVSHTSVKWGEGQKLCDIRKREDEEDVRQVVYITSTELQPGLEPTEEASDSAVTQETPLALSVCLSHWPGLAPTKTATPLPSLRLPTLSFHPHSPFLHFLWLLPPPRLSFLLWPPSFTQLLFLFTLMTPHFWSLEPFHPLHPQSMPSSYDLSISFRSPLYPWIWFTQPPLHILALFSPIPFPLQNHPWYLFDCHQSEERWKSILPPATASLWLRRKGRQLAGL